MTRLTASLLGGVCLGLFAWGCGDHGAPEPSGENGGVVEVDRSAARPAPKPVGPLPEQAACVNDVCHAALADARQVHRPIADGACDACHGPDTGTHVFPLLRQANETCTHCHDVSQTLAHQHQPVKDNGCLTCHDPHASPTRYLLTAISVERLCAECHDKPLGFYSHTPFAEGQCTLCHDPHQADNRALLRTGGGRDHCLTCHVDFDDKVGGVSALHAPAAEGCLSCHDAHTSAFAAQTLAAPAELCGSCHAEVDRQIESAAFIHGAVGSDDGCNSCHAPHGGAQRAFLRDREDTVCLTCHAEPGLTPDGRTLAAMAPVLDMPFLHGPIREGQCSPCHAPHAADHASLLKQAFPDSFYVAFDLDAYALCFQCHASELVTTRETASSTEFRNGEVNLHFVHVNRSENGRTCKTCHEIHGSDLPNHMAASVPFQGSGWAMPLGFEKRDDGGSCAPGCHEPRRYQRRQADGAAPEAGGET